jgi:hypothetical protein
MSLLVEKMKIMLVEKETENNEGYESVGGEGENNVGGECDG